MANWLYVSQSTDGWRNLGVDEYFLDRAGAGASIVRAGAASGIANFGPEDMLLHFYVNANAVIIGRGQNPWAECDLGAMERDGVQLVRRVTGGGAVFHDVGNLNFSFIAGEGVYDVQRQLNLILRAVRSLGVSCAFSGRNDLLADGRKFSGNAFCARGRARQHHGTLLIDADLSRLENYLNVDPRKLRAKGAKSVRSRVCNLRELAPELTRERVLSALKGAYREEYGAYAELSSAVLDEAAIAPYVEKQASEAWRLGQTPRFDVEIENRFAWGNVQLLLTLRHGRVDALEVYTDAIDVELADAIRRRLPGVAYDARALAEALADSPRAELRELAAYIRGLTL